ncbi:MAG: PAS domain-containing protein, partial [Candidatus Poribacteria bacterium]
MDFKDEPIPILFKEHIEKCKPILDTSVEAVFIQTIDGKIIDCNRSAHIIFGYSKDDFTCLSLPDILLCDEPLLEEKFFETIGR